MIYRFYKGFFLTAVLLMTFFSLSAQVNYDDLRPGQIKRYGLEAMRNGDLYTAIDYLSVYIDQKPDDAKILFALGELYFMERNYSVSGKYYSMAFKEKRKKYPQAQFKFAECLKMQGKYEEALKEFKIFKRYRGDVDDSEYLYYKDRLRSEIEGCELALADTLKKNYIISNPGKPINHRHIDFNPIPIGIDNLVFSSLQIDDLKYYDPVKDTIPRRKIYMAEKRNNEWDITGEFPKVNHPDYNTGNGSFSHDGKRFYFTRCSKEFDERMICRIYKTEFKDGEWQEPEILNEEINDPYFTSTMPAVGVSRRNTDMLYFVSDRENGRGGMDIWYTYWDPRREEYMRPRNCGRRINTVGDEVSPFYHVDSKTLFFSSNAFPNYGGLDVFSSSGSGRKFSDPVNIGKPVNTEVDELYFSKADEGYFGYFVSNRAGGSSLRHETCCDDIYHYIDSDYIRVWLTGKIYGITDLNFFNSIRSEYEQNLTLNNIDQVYDTSSMELVHRHPVSLFILDDESGEETFIKTDSTIKGTYWFNLEQGKDYRIKVKDFNRDEKIYSLSTKEIVRDDTVRMDAIIVNTIPTEPLVLKNVYYEYNSAKLSKEARENIERTIYKILNEYPRIVVEISSHSDNVGSDQFNLDLSQRRAESVVDFLVDKGIDKARLKAKGYGESQPIAPNENSDGSPNEEGQSKNRRTEFKIIGELEDYTGVVYEE